MTTHFEDIIRQNSQRLADLRKTTEDLQRELSEARVSLERQLSRSPHGHEVMQEQIPDLYLGPPEESLPGPHGDPMPSHYSRQTAKSTTLRMSRLSWGKGRIMKPAASRIRLTRRIRRWESSITAGRAPTGVAFPVAARSR